jgi:uncharacterized protein (TIRG00374 family)
LRINRIAAAGVGLSIGFVVAYSLLFGVKLEDLASIGFATLVVACVLIILRLLIEGLRFHLLSRALGIRGGVAGSVLARISSEFVSLSTPSFVGGEAVRLAWLKSRGADLGKSTWIIFLEIYLDVVSTALVVYASASYLLLYHQEYLLTSLAALASTATTIFFTAIYLFSKKKTLYIPNWLQKVIRFILGDSKGGRLIASFNQTLLSYHSSAVKTNSLFTYKQAFGILLCIALMILLSGAITQLIIGDTASVRGFILSTSGFYLTLAVSSLPVTIGGSGISELVLNHFTTNILGSSSWAKVIAWRIITYHIPLTISGISLAVLSYKGLTNKRSTFKLKT